MKPRILCLRSQADFLRVGAPAPAALDVTYRAPADPDVADLVAAAEGLVIPAVGPKLDAEIFEGSRLKLIQVTGAGVDRLDKQAMLRLEVPVANVAGGSNAAVAEYATTIASLLLRRFAWSGEEIRAGRYAEFRAKLLAGNVGGIEGLLVGIVGLGTIGMAVARAFKAQGCRIAYFDPAPADLAGAAKLSAEPLELAALLARADVVTLHVPLLAETRNMIGRNELALMKPSAILINAARGGIVDEAALAEALHAGKLGGAAVDVYSTEPPEASNPLLHLGQEGARRLIMTPHIAGVTRQASAFLFRSAWENVERVLVRGEPPLNRVY